MNQPQVLRALILNGADPNIRNYEGNTALHQICNSGNLNCAIAMLSPLTVEEKNFCIKKNYPIVKINFEQKNFNGKYFCFYYCYYINFIILFKFIFDKSLIKIYIKTDIGFFQQ